MTYGIIFPVYNEEKRLKSGITRAVEYFETLSIDYKLLIVDNASTDSTREVANLLCESYKNVEYIRILEKGVGIAVRTGIERLDAEVVGYMDIDLATDLRHFEEVISIFTNEKDIDFINGSRFSKTSTITGKKWYRNITSYGLLFLLKALLGMKASDAICGFKFIKRNVALDLLNECSEEKGWFLIIELLIRAERKHVKLRELPVRWTDDADNSKVEVFETIVNYIKQIIILRKRFKSE